MCSALFESVKEKMKEYWEWYNGTTDSFESPNFHTKLRTSETGTSKEAKQHIKENHVEANKTENQGEKNKNMKNKSVAYGVLANAAAKFLPTFEEEAEENLWPTWNEERKINNTWPNWNTERKIDNEWPKWNTS